MTKCLVQESMSYPEGNSYIAKFFVLFCFFHAEILYFRKYYIGELNKKSKSHKKKKRNLAFLLLLLEHRKCFW